MALTDEQVERYVRHLILKGVGVKGQKRLLASSVLIIGAGGLGSPAACIWRRPASAISDWWTAMWWI